MVRRTGEGDDGSIGSYWATRHMSLSPSEDEKAPMPEISLFAERNRTFSLYLAIDV